MASWRVCRMTWTIRMTALLRTSASCRPSGECTQCIIMTCAQLSYMLGESIHSCLIPSHSCFGGKNLFRLLRRTSDSDSVISVHSPSSLRISRQSNVLCSQGSQTGQQDMVLGGIDRKTMLISRPRAYRICTVLKSFFEYFSSPSAG